MQIIKEKIRPNNHNEFFVIQIFSSLEKSIHIFNRLARTFYYLKIDKANTNAK